MKQVVLCVLAVLAVRAAAIEDDCTAFVVGKKASATGRVIVGHNNDGFGPMKYAILPATDSAPALQELNRVQGLGGGKSPTLYWHAVYSDKAKAGKATGDVLLNEHGVIMFSNSGGFMREWEGQTASLPDEDTAQVTDGGLGLALRFEVIRRAKSAAEGVKIATALIDQYGYGPDARTFTIADRDEAWILCAVRGRRYVARRCPDDAVMAFPNILPVGKILPGDIVSPGIEDKRDTFDFAAAYQGPRTKHDPTQKYRILEFYRIAAGVPVDENELPWSVKPAHPVSVEDLKRGFSSHAVGKDRESIHPEEIPGVAWPVCRRATLESVICPFAANPADTCISLAPGHPCSTKYDEFRPFKDEPPAYFATGAAAERLYDGRLFRTSPTPGWENVNPKRQEFPPIKVVWRAPVDGFDVQHEGGAEGEVAFEGGAIRICKTNGKGRITVRAPAFSAEKGKALRLFADVSARTETPDATVGYLSAQDANRGLVPVDPITAKVFSQGGKSYMRTLVNSAPGMTYRKYAHFKPTSEPVTPVIVVEGAPSESEWRNWTAEDLAAAQSRWGEHWERLSAQNRSGDRAGSETFEKSLAADIDHTAQIVTRDGYSRFLLDGKETPPFAYKVSGRDGAQYSGKPLQRYGVKVGCIVLALGELPGRRAPWNANGFDVKMAVDKIRDSMRMGDESCFILALSCSAYPAFTEVEHPDETWRRKDGSVVRGNSGSAIPDEYNDGGKLDKGDRRWPWVSYASPAWRGAIKDITTKLVAELKRTGLSKRIIGVHFCGYHDGQFASPVEDHSVWAKAEYRKFLSARGLKPDEPGAEYSAFVRRLGYFALEDFSREAKRLFGKPIIAVRWCMRPLGGHKDSAYDIDAFTRSDAVDVIIPQPTYSQRLPALSQGVRLPCQTLHRHGKMMWYEFDLRTYAALERWAKSVVDAKGLGTADDLPMWQTVFRKHAGIMLAQRMGWWLYDMAGGWFYPDEIARDCGEVFSFCRELMKVAPDPWHPDAALVVDERAMAAYNTPDGPKVGNARNLLMSQWPRTAASGVPYDFYLAEDVYDDPEVMKRYKAVALGAFLKPDARQKAFRTKLDAWGVRTFVIGVSGYSSKFFNDFVKEAGGYVATRPGVVQVDMNGDFVSVHCLVPGRHDFRLPFPAKVVNVKSGLEEKVVDGVLPIEMSAGETCWFRLFRK